MSQVIESAVGSELVDAETEYINQADHDAEQGVLAALLVNAHTRHQVRARVSPEMLGSAYHQALWRVIESAEQRGELPDSGQVYEAFQAVHVALVRDGSESDAMMQRLSQVIECQPFGGELDRKIDLVEQAHARRAMTIASHRLRGIADGAYGWCLDELRDAAAQATTDLVEATTAKTGDVTSVVDEWDAFLDEVDRNADAGLATGLADLDRLARVRPGNYVVVGARTSMGKSAFCLTIARLMATKNPGTRVVYLSYEMNRQACRERLVSAAAGVLTTSISRGQLDDDERGRVANAVHKLPESLHVPNTPSRRLSAAVGAIYQEAAAAEVAGQQLVVFVDYAQQIQVDGNAPQREKLELISNSLQQAAQETGAVVFGAAQLNRDADKRESHLPEMSDIRDCDVFAHDADHVWLLYRPDYYERDDPRMGEMDVLVKKNRGGPTATVTVAHQLHFARVCNMGRSADAPADALAGAVPKLAAVPDPVSGPTCSGCRDELIDPADIAAGCHRDTCGS